MVEYRGTGSNRRNLSLLRSIPVDQGRRVSFTVIKCTRDSSGMTIGVVPNDATALDERPGYDSLAYGVGYSCYSGVYHKNASKGTVVLYGNGDTITVDVDRGAERGDTPVRFIKNNQPVDPATSLSSNVDVAITVSPGHDVESVRIV